MSVSRLVADEHWITDNALGFVTGILYGYVLPRWLNYGWGGTRRPTSLVGRWAPRFDPSFDGGTIGAMTRF